ncbi:receptor-type tyrosine-protein phosphatase H-like isoform X2 [Erpetoichthys calabaricus]|uniref:receptor-type tyrosine-protein phosphatase H-like isoform X2 n=1 Tax=Erpetoichthys calabaricus TaxID=27687 RepID=UPI002234B488|nr:receptor-type tyrosine-protein phosphatase H-like isoform X2 [Erpetoichthys calabaricus]
MRDSTEPRSKWQPIPLQDFRQHCERLAANSNEGFQKEFEELKNVGERYKKSAAEHPANKRKNRWLTVLPYDHTRVKLTIKDGNPSSDYINASFIPGFSKEHEYISTQGPLAATIEDFWRMIWEYDVQSIVMLTLCMEHGKELCAAYWPSADSPVVGGQIQVRRVTEERSSDWTITMLNLTHSISQVERKVCHFHYTAWPDRGVPVSPASLTSFAELVREHLDKIRTGSPPLVHCSAGVGRSGTFIALDWALQQRKLTGSINVTEIVYKMRNNRCLMVQNLEQYVFLHNCLLQKSVEEASGQQAKAEFFI